MKPEELVANFTDKSTIPSAFVISFLRQYERDHGFSKKEMASRIGMSQQSYNALNHGKTVSGRVVLRISEALHVPLSQFFRNEEEEIKEIFKQYPIAIIRWLTTRDGVSAILRSYREHLESESKKRIDGEMDAIDETFSKIELKK